PILPAKESLKVLAQSKSTLCIFLSVSHLEKIVEELLPSYGPDCPVAVVYKSTWKEEKIVRTSLSRLAEDVRREGIKKTALIIVGEVLSRDFERSRVYQSP
ncbi:MAG: cobalt-precorrin-4 C(11)-methyltransferase, partial [Candidatus Brocadiales bacterium]|nr:cobalt-precorrin-4 C(11)-methyltransferase [Candidatus Bathyanammoxibius sp.]